MSKTCPKCQRPVGVHAPYGLCPACLLEAMAGEDDAETRLAPEDARGRALEQEALQAAQPGDDAEAPKFGDDFPMEIGAELEPLKPEASGEHIGRYKLLQQIGEGGFGTVWMAEQTEPITRRVALKIIKLGMDTREVIARFEQERQALAMMDHPNIARVFDAGVTQWGRPFFVMELVRGIPITRFCDEQQWGTRERLALFGDVCAAINHAHQKGIIHRDIKPSNVMVTLHGEKAVVKVIDFGVAKATQGKLTDKTLFTRFEQFIGTPVYMSPEQASLSGLDIDTRSDIYALGILLYELLTGKPPFDARTLASAGYEEMRRIIREVEPPKPSSRLSTLAGDERQTLARARQIEPKKIGRLVESDLDWIVMKAIEKDRTRRYETANGLAQDIVRFLADEPVSATPPSAVYRFQKFARRHKGALRVAATIAGVLVVAMAVSVHQAVRATRARNDAQLREELADDLLRFMLGDVRAELKKINRLEVLDKVGRRAMAYFDALQPGALTDAMLTAQSEALTQIGDVRLDQVRFGEAAAAYTAAFERGAALAVRHPKNADMLFARAQAEFGIGEAARQRGDFSKAHRWLSAYRDSALALVALEGRKRRAQQELIYGHHNLAVLEFSEGQLESAKTGFLAEQAISEAVLRENVGDIELRSGLADSASWLGFIADGMGNYAEAIGWFREMATRYGELAAAEPVETGWEWELRAAQSQTLLGTVELVLGQREEAAAHYASAAAKLKRLLEHDPENRLWQGEALGLELDRVQILLAQGEALNAEPMATQARTQLEALLQAEPASIVFGRLLMKASRLEAQLHWSAGKPDAQERLQRAFELGTRGLRENRADKPTRLEFAQACILAGRFATARKEPETARDHWENALKSVQPLADDSRDREQLDPAVQALLLLGRKEEARPLFERLEHLGYHPADPLAAALLEAAHSTH